jgi:hypothetical protein
MRKIIEFLGLLGHLHSITNRFPSSHFLTYKKVLSKKHSIFHNSFNTFQVHHFQSLGSKLVLFLIRILQKNISSS